MSLIAILGALLLEQIFPLSSYTRLRIGLRGAIDYVENALASDNAKPWQIFWFITVVGALLAGLLLTQVQSISSLYISPVWSDPLLFGIMVLVLMWRPQGLFGKLGSA